MTKSVVTAVIDQPSSLAKLSQLTTGPVQFSHPIGTVFVNSSTACCMSGTGLGTTIPFVIIGPFHKALAIWTALMLSEIASATAIKNDQSCVPRL